MAFLTRISHLSPPTNAPPPPPTHTPAAPPPCTTPRSARAGRGVSLSRSRRWKPLENEPVDDARELPQVATLFGDGDVGQVLVHHRVAEAPRARTLRI